jgi:hypothetical protein
VLKRCSLCKNFHAAYLVEDPRLGKLNLCYNCWKARQTASRGTEVALKFRRVLVDGNNPPDPHCKAAGDLDGDGRADLLAASASGGGTWWYRAPGWSKHLLAEGGFTTDMAVGDIDGDGCLDVVIPENEAGLLWLQNPLSEGRDPASGPWKAHNISPLGAAMHDVELADLDGDGRLDVVTRHQSGFGSLKGNRIYIWKQNSPDDWSLRTLDCPHGEGLALGDVDGDGRPDILIGGRWYRNPGDILSGDWQEHLYIAEEDFERGWTNGDVMVACGDLDGDGQLEIVLSPSEGRGRLAWFDPPSDPAAWLWVEHLLAETDHAHGLAVGDVDGDGQLEIAVAKMHQASAPQEVAVYDRAVFDRAVYDSQDERWLKIVLSTSGSHCIRLVDLEGDGRLSVFGCNWNNHSPTGGALELWVQE